MSRQTARGFTLIEVLVVVVIVGIISAVVLLSTNLIGNDRPLRQEARRVASLLELASDEALLQGRDLGIEIMQSSYRFVEYDPYLNLWHEIIGDDLLRPRNLDEGLRFELWVEDRLVQLNENPQPTGENAEDEERDRNDDPGYAPHALILSSGELTPFDLRIVRDRDRLAMDVTVSPAGAIEVDDGSDTQG